MSTPYTAQGFTIQDAGRRIVVDPITRIEGHLRCEVNINDDNVITNAVSCGTLFRGLEIILKNRDPRDAWAFTERICGVCTGTHALASVRAVEDALGIVVPNNANSIRNLMQLALWFHDHIVHFYHLAGLDWVDVVSAAKADPAKTSALAQSLSAWPSNSPGVFAEVRDKVQRILASGNLGLFSNGYWGHPGYKLPPEGNLMVLTHYIQALDFQKDIVKIHTVFGGKNPHPNWLVGGVPTAINVDGVGGDDVINTERLELVHQIIKRCQQFAQQVMLPDLLAASMYYKDWFHIGTGLSAHNIMSYGEFPILSGSYSNNNLLIPSGAIVNGNFNDVHAIDFQDIDQIQEFVDHSWYNYPAPYGKQAGLHPYAGITDPHYELGSKTIGTRTDIKQLDENAPYSWIKTPRWRGHMMEVGPLARVLVAYYSNHADTVPAVDELCGRIGIPVKGLCSVMGRMATRVHEAVWSTQAMQFFYDQLISAIKNGQTAVVDVSKWDSSTWPTQCKGVGISEAPRGSLGHWVTINNTKIENYQCVVPTTWNAAPRSPEGQLGAYEAALMGVKLAVPNQPLEILRTLHSFDPCLACATHVMQADGSTQVVTVV